MLQSQNYLSASATFHCMTGCSRHQHHSTSSADPQAQMFQFGFTAPQNNIQTCLCLMRCWSSDECWPGHTHAHMQAQTHTTYVMLALNCVFKRLEIGDSEIFNFSVGLPAE